MFYILSIEITRSNLSIALSLNKDILSYEQNFVPNNQSDLIVNMIEKCLHHAKLDYHNLNYVVLTNDPASFTSTRIGLSAASAILTATKAKGVSVPYFDLLFYRARRHVKDLTHFICLIQAKKNSVYCKEFFIDDTTKNITSSHPQEMSKEHLINKISLLNTQTVFCGNGVNNMIDIPYNNNIIILPRIKIVRAMYLCDYIYHKIIHDPQSLNEDLEPIYIKS